MRLLRAMALGLLCLGFLAGSTLAAPGGDLQPGEQQFDPDHSTNNTYTSGNPPSGSPVATMTVAFSTASFTGNLTSNVYYTNGTDASGGLTFGYIVEHTGTGNQIDGIEDTNLELPGFAGWFISEAGAREGTGPEPFIIDRTLSGAPGAVWTMESSGAGDGNIDAGETGSEFWFVVPNARVWSTGTMLIQDGTQVSVAAFVPAPEPGTLALIGGALVTLGVIRRRRSQKASA